MPIAQAKDMANNGGGSDTARVVEAGSEPHYRHLVVFREEMPHDRLEPGPKTAKQLEHPLVVFSVC